MGITLSKKTLSKGRISLYLDCSIDGKRRKEYLGIILEVPTSKEIRKANREKIQLAQLIRSRREMEYLQSRFLIQPAPSTSTKQPETATEQTGDFFTFATNYLEEYKGKDYRVVRGMLRHLKEYHKPPLPISGITHQFCYNFLRDLQSKLTGNTPINYFKKFKLCLNLCVEEGLLQENPSDHIRMSQYYDVTKEILSTEEMNRLVLTDCRHKEVKRAFLFACQSGLRWCDICELTFRSIDFPQRRLTLIQKKVAGHSRQAVLHLNLNNNAIRLLEEETIGTPDKKVFSLPSHSYALRILNEWTRSAGIRKHISFHCARHTFITQIMASGASIKTAASLAGHSSTRHTEKYIHIIDTQKQQAVDSLPPLPL